MQPNNYISLWINRYIMVLRWLIAQYSSPSKPRTPLYLYGLEGDLNQLVILLMILFNMDNINYISKVDIIISLFFIPILIV